MTVHTGRYRARLDGAQMRVRAASATLAQRTIVAGEGTGLHRMLTYTVRSADTVTGEFELLLPLPLCEAIAAALASQRE